MCEVFSALCNNFTWTLVPSSPTYNIIGRKWVYRIKQNPDGSVAHYNAHIVTKGFHQRPSFDFTDTFSPIVKLAILHLVLSIDVSQDGPYVN